MTAEIYRDAWGVPHLRADSARALARLQGLVTARDRAWQLEVERHRAQGTSASFLGPEALPWDRFVRRARLDDTARRCFDRLERRDPETADWVRAYVDGVNEGLAEARCAGRASEQAAGRASEQAAGRASEQAAGRASEQAAGRASEQAAGRASEQAAGRASEQAAGRVPDPASGQTPSQAPSQTPAQAPDPASGQAPDPASGQTPSQAPSQAPSRTPRQAPSQAPRQAPSQTLSQTPSQAPEFARVGLVPGGWEAWTPLAVWLATHILFAGFPAKLWREEAARRLGPEAVGLFAADGPGTSGSNGWLVSGARTVTGQPVIAGDPHRFIEDPGVYQQIRLACDEFDVVGLAVPGVPGIAHFGHTGTVAWAITNAMADYQDLYRERLRRTGAGVEALGPDGTWRRVARHTELVRVAGEETSEVEVLETERGPVIAGGPEGLDDGTPDEDDGIPLALSLRYPPRVTADLGFGALLPLLRARRVADVDRALDLWAEPVNVVQAADTEGGLLHRVAGRVPLRAAANGTRLVPAWEPGHEWTGWHETPRAGLTDGVAVMANQRGLSGELGVEFAPPHRADRIGALLAEKRAWTASDMPALHMDTYLASAAPLLDHLTALDDLGDLTTPAAALRDRLLRWDRRMDADSRDAAGFAALRSALVRRLAAHPAFASLTTPPAYPEVFRPWLALLPRVGFALEHLLRAEELYGIDRPALVREALEEAAGQPQSSRQQSAQPSQQRWGDTHRLAPWRALPDASDQAGPALSGDHDCVLCTSAVPGWTDLAARGPAARYVWDLARREDSRWVVPYGASGLPGHPHHHDQLPLWLKGELAPVVTDWAHLTKESDDD
ncbi:penicillin amidase [Streptomyces sp. yr375]|uniref:penicillin acylase family protein n=1 Tax=Streptomyces sp. yr375 TaxID=1761906 RepID=UPI0008B23A5B|nr:penicillin acylase family protein [Streptomyces sp. yr375]SES39196.1 penicillin amidase [Streptomyces sp. yr375]